MSDLFHKDVPGEFVDHVFDTMEEADRHVFQILTKRSPLMRDYLRKRYGAKQSPQHIWCGVSVEDENATVRIRHLKEVACLNPFSVHRASARAYKRFRCRGDFLGHRRR